MSLVPKEKHENGYRREKVSLVPKGKFENGYRREKRVFSTQRKA